MQRNGWEFAVERDIYHDKYNVIAHHPKAGCTAYGSLRREFKETSEPLHLNVMTNSMQFRLTTAIATEYVRVDMTPHHQTYEDIYVSGIFRPMAETSQDIIVDPASVQQLMEQIKRLQAPELEAIRKRDRVRNERIVAQVISLEAA
jgi:hypothetical protein